MTEYKTMRVPVDAWEAAREEKQENETWGEFLQRCSNEGPNVESGVDADALAARIVDQIGSDVGGPKVDDSEIARAVARELDYTELADKVAQRVVSQLR